MQKPLADENFHATGAAHPPSTLNLDGSHVCVCLKAAEMLTGGFGRHSIARILICHFFLHESVYVLQVFANKRHEPHGLAATLGAPILWRRTEGPCRRL